MSRKRKASDLDLEKNQVKKSRTNVTQSQASVPGPSTPKSKGKRKGKDKETVRSPERRLARYRGHCPISVEERLDRALAQRFFLIHRERDDGTLREVFTVSGSTGNVYTVTISNLPNCNCPDSLKGNHCKHIMFVFFKVLQVPRSSFHWYQKALLNSELQEIFDAAPAPPQLRAHGSIADARIIQAWNRATGRVDAETSTAAATSNVTDNRRIPTPEDDCPICYDSMHDENKTTVESLVGSLEWCHQCCNAVHKGCWDNYLKFQRTKSTEPVKCVWCRAPWRNEMTSGGGTKASEGYVNLAGLPGMEDVGPERDHSTYHFYSGRRYSRY
ncbi:hypothetical protein L218DRAFT_742380 [Marasmius fiardii PR-910]|nr:hypothetical protein L218DRAFT_742380 [Marasmius fiardii PR-910]